MPDRKNRFYVTARYDTATAYLCGPFITAHAAQMMVPAVSRAAQLTDDPRMAFASFGVTKTTRTAPGTLDYGLFGRDGVFGWIVNPYPKDRA